MPMAPQTIAFKCNQRIIVGNLPAAFALRAAGLRKEP
jgi:hypothetical protein